MLDLITAAELPRYGVPQVTIDRCSDEEIATAIEIGSSEAYCHLSAAYTESLTVVPAALKKHVAACILKHLLDTRGRSPMGDDSLIDTNYDNALKFFKAIQKSEQNLPSDTVPERDECITVAQRTTSGRSGW